MNTALFKNRFFFKKRLTLLALILIAIVSFGIPSFARATTANAPSSDVQPYDLTGHLSQLNSASQGSLAAQSWYAGDVKTIQSQAENVYNSALENAQTPDQAQALANSVLEAGAVKIDTTFAAQPSMSDYLTNFAGESFPNTNAWLTRWTGIDLTSGANNTLSKPYQATAAYDKALADAQNAAGNSSQAANTNNLAAGNTQTAVTAQQGGFNSNNAGNNEPIHCLWGSGAAFTIMNVDISGCIAMGAYNILWLSSWVLWACAIFFNISITYTLNMASFLRDTPIVDIGWSTFKNMANIFFIFIILWIAINTILGWDGYGIKKMLSKVIIAAVLINFSLFFTQVGVDFSNIIALQFFTKLVNNSAITNGAGNSHLNDADAGISAAFAKAMGIDSVWTLGSLAANSGGAVQTNTMNIGGQNGQGGLNSKNLIIVGLGGTVFTLITAFVFFAGAIMLMIRALELVFLMILSPIAFMGGLVPSLAGPAKDWQKKLTTNLIFAPVYMALMYLVTSMVMQKQNAVPFFMLFTGSTNAIVVLVNFVVLNSLMFGCLMVASSVGASGSKWALKTGNGLLQSGANKALAPVRFTVGGTASRIRNSDTIKGLASSRVGRALGAGMLLRGADGLASTKIGGKSFDDARKAKEALLTKTADIISDIKQKKGESEADFQERKAAALQAGRDSMNSIIPGLDKSYGFGARASAQGGYGKKIGQEKKKAQVKEANKAKLTELENEFKEQYEEYKDGKKIVKKGKYHETAIAPVQEKVNDLTSVINEKRSKIKEGKMSHEETKTEEIILNTAVEERKELQKIIDRASDAEDQVTALRQKLSE